MPAAKDSAHTPLGPKLNVNSVQLKNKQYVGETAPNVYTRSREHQRNYAKKAPKLFMYRHKQAHHFGAEAEFKARVQFNFKDCLTRQISEGVAIRQCEKKKMAPACFVEGEK